MSDSEENNQARGSAGNHFNREAPVLDQPYSRSFDRKGAPVMAEVQFGLTNEDQEDLSRSGKYEFEVNDMAKTSMFGGHI